MNTSEDGGRIIGIDAESMAAATRFYVKVKDRAYKHCVWAPPGLVHSSRVLVMQLPKWMKYEGPFRKSFIEGLYLPDFIVFDETYVEEEAVLRICHGQYLIKWRALSITQSTWEDTAKPEVIKRHTENNENTIPSVDAGSYKRDPEGWVRFLESPDFPNGGTLKDYQVDGLNWLLKCWHERRSSILADEMGLGKTIQVLAVLNVLRNDYKVKGPFLICVPLSTVPNWEREISLWTHFRSVSLIGTEAERDMIKEYLLFHRRKNGQLDKNFLITDIILTTYEMLSMEKEALARFEFAYAIFDEAHRLKTDTTKVYLNACRIHANHIVLMTGTPIQNNVNELWSLMHFLHPREFNDLDSFVSEFGDIRDHEKLDNLQRKVLPYILRRKKADVELALSGKEETVIEVELTQVQRTLYRSLLDDNREWLLTNMGATRPNFNNIMMQARKVCNHPFLIKGMEDLCLENYKHAMHIEPGTPVTTEIEYGSLVRASGKMILLDKLLPKLQKDGHKVLIFSQMTSMLDIIEDYLRYKGYLYERLDGSTSLMHRKVSVERFTDADEVFVFILSTRAGGLGLNLTSADTVIIYDSDWNPQNDIQAQARCHRIGQTKDVKVYRLITRATYEAEMFVRVSKKLALDYALLDANARNQEADELSASEIDMILKRGAYYTFMEECTEADKFCEEDIDTILENRSSTAVRDFVGGRNSLFRKAAFKGDDEQDPLADPEFWKRLLPAEDDSVTQKRRVRRSTNYSGDETGQDGLFKASEVKATRKVLRSHGIMGVMRANGNELLARSLIAYLYKQHAKKSMYKQYVSVAVEQSKLYGEIRKIIKRRVCDDIFDEFEGSSLPLLTSAMTADQVYVSLAYLSNEQIPEDVELVPFHACPTFWTPYHDFDLLLWTYQQGISKSSPLAKVTQQQVIARYQGNVSIKWLISRVFVLARTLAAIAPRHYYDSPQPIVTLNEFKKRHPRFAHDIKVIPRYRQRIILHYCYMMGPYLSQGHIHFQYTQRAFRMTQYAIESVYDFFYCLLECCSAFQPELMPSHTYSASVSSLYSFDWVPKHIMLRIAQRLWLFIRVRKANVRSLTAHDMWYQAPAWWHPTHDQRLLSAVRNFGFYSLSIYHMALSNATSTGTSPGLMKKLRDKYLDEEETLTPSPIEETWGLVFLIDSNVVAQRIESLLAH